MEIKTLAIVGCGKLAEIVVDAIIKGLLPNYRLVGAVSRTLERAQYLSDKINSSQKDIQCNAFESVDNLLALKVDYIVESANPEALKNFALRALKNGSSLVPLSLGAFANEKFYEDVQKIALENNVKVYIPSGAIGGLDVMRTIALMGESTVNFKTEKSPASLVDTDVYDEKLETEKREVFNGNAKEAIALFPTKVNVAVAASLASVGTNNINVSINSIPGYSGDKHCITMQSDGVTAQLDVYSKTSDIAGWSVVNTLRNIASPIVF